MTLPARKLIRLILIISAGFLLQFNSIVALGKFPRVDNFALLDQQGRQHELRKYGDSEALVLISVASACESSIENLPEYQLLRTMWERQGIEFLGIAAAPDESLESARLLDELYHFDLPILLDSSQLVAEGLGIEKIGEIVVLDPGRQQMLYRGGLDVGSQADRSESLAAVLNDVAQGIDHQAEMVSAPTAGCTLSFPQKELHLATVPDYVGEVTPILNAKCVSCHVEGGIGPFPMDSHQMVQGWSPMIKEVLMSRRMPPAQVDPHVNHFSNARYLSAAELQTLVHWIDAGAPRGEGGHDPLTRRPEPMPVWELGEPDYIVDVPAFTVPATGVLDYENVTINLPFSEDVWIKSVQHLPGDRRVLHHLLSFIVPADYAERIVEGENDRYREFLEGYAPGKVEASSFPEGAGVFVPEGSAVQMSLHYTTFGKEVVDRTQLGLYFAEVIPRHQYSTYALSYGGSNIEIPPGVAEHKMSASHVFDDEIMLHGLRPHMHFRGKYMRFRVVYPDGTQDDILNVPDYNFNWQPTYRLSEPMLLAAGSRVIIEGAFDNSEYNLGNPDPGAAVRGGAQSWDEMFIGYFSYYKTR